MFLNASLVVQLVMIMLLLASLISWTMIFKKRAVMKTAVRAANEFEDRFWSGADLSSLYQQLTDRRQNLTGMSAIFESGFKEFSRLSQQARLDSMDLVEGSQRAMRVTLNREVDHLEIHLPFLATVGSTSPYIGLFGTVWGIMNSFHALGNVNHATISMVAPGISEALVEVIARHSPDVVAIESVFYAKNVKSAIVMSHARGVALLSAASASLDVFEYSPSTIKLAVVGYGAATKDQVQQMGGAEHARC